MKGNAMGRGLKFAAASLALTLGMTACSRDYTVAYLYVTSATRTNMGVVNAYAIDYQSGSLEQLSDSPIPSGGSNPVTLVASPNAQNIYVVNHDTSTVVHFSIGTDGKLYAQTTTNVVQANGITGSFPVAAAIDPNGAYLYVAFTFQNGFTTANPGPGGIATFPIGSDGNLGAALINTTVGTTSANPLPYVPVGNNPTAMYINPKSKLLYVVDQERPANGAANGVMLVFNANTTTGAITSQVAGTVQGGVAAGTTVLGGFRAGTQPSSIVIEPAGLYIYVTDSLTNTLLAYQTNGGAVVGAPLALTSSPYATGQFPANVTVDPRGQYIYVANFGSGTVSAYTIGTGGALSGVAGGSSVGAEPSCVTIEPALGIYLFTSNNLDNSVTGEQLDPHSGMLKPVQGNNFAAGNLPTCAVAVANGAHATQIVH